MVNVRLFLLMTELQTEGFREETAADENYLNLHKVLAGPHRGK